MSSYEIGGKTIYEVPPPNASSGPDTADRFDQSQKEWSDTIIDEALEYICEYYSEYDVTKDDIYNIEDAFDGEYSEDDILRILHILDYGGMDLRVDCSAKMVDVALRLRPDRSDADVDFSFRTENGIEGKQAEYDKWMNAYNDRDGYYPGIAAFGVVGEDLDGFEEFHIIVIEPFLEAIEHDEIHGDGPYDSPGGAKALYYPIDDLRDAGCVWETFVENGEEAV